MLALNVILLDIIDFHMMTSRHARYLLHQQ